MRVLVSGATGLIGQKLSEALQRRGDTPVALTRSPDKYDGEAVGWSPAESRLEVDALRGFDAVVHLAGESIASGPWTKARKARIHDSRVKGTLLLSETLAQLPVEERPAVLLSASASGIYGSRGEHRLDESSTPGAGFLADVCLSWEASADAARDAGIRVVHPRFGVVFAKEGGALPLMAKPFSLGLGGKIGPGTQYMSWVALEDVVGLLLWCLDHPEVSGPVNVAAPNPVTNAELTRTLGKVLSRPTFFAVPTFAAKLLGDMADEMLLASQRVIPAKAEAGGYTFVQPELEPCLRALLT